MVAAAAASRRWLCIFASAASLAGLAIATSEEDRVRARLEEAASVIGHSQPETVKQCECEDYCQGRCFAASCVACDVSTWSFPGGEPMCLDSGPLGTGLLCRTTPDGKPTKSACCGKNDGPCALPEGSCCASGSCKTCPKFHPEQKLFPPLDDERTHLGLRRHFDKEKNACSIASGAEEPVIVS
eukprot:TRINITY_DN32092_c0_g1_i1.p1 TRINITY_DN32092_c0_g1~~TRINITY_DN32092_c0_g1_i1.p1  ORF type:complete len:184 (-),score=42.32 TRINITY_DN32092_c0_g1_i1:74-625(-)